MLVAIRPMSLGPFAVAGGERITREMCEVLPPGRMAVLIEHRYVEEIADEVADTRAVDQLEFRVQKLETQVASLMAALRRSPKAPAGKEG